MPIEVEVNMRIPSFTVRTPDQPDLRIDNRTVRFTRRIAVDAIPKPNDGLQLSARLSKPLECVVTRADWNEETSIFVVSCSYARRSITVDEYNALLADPEWVSKQLPGSQA